MNVEWALPAIGAGLQNRKEIGNLLSAALGFILGKRTSIAITGMAGAGKTVLLDHLTSKASKPGYKLPHQSQFKEREKASAEGKRLRLSVVPGQEDTFERRDALRELFSPDQPVDGVVHVVANGLATVRNHEAAQHLITVSKIDSISKLQKVQLEEELRDLGETCDAVRDAHLKSHGPRWLIVAVDKVDLYYDKIQSARARYSPLADEPFADRLRELSKQVGTTFFRWEIVPVCAHLQKFEWNGEALMPQIDDAGRDLFLAQFKELLASYCK